MNVEGATGLTLGASPVVGVGSGVVAEALACSTVDVGCAAACGVEGANAGGAENDGAGEASIEVSGTG